MNNQDNNFRPVYTPDQGSYQTNPSPSPAPQAPRTSSGLAITSLVFGILSLCCCCCGGLPFGIPAVILAIVDGTQKKTGVEGGFHMSGAAIAGLICGILGIVISVLIGVTYGIGYSQLSVDDIEEFRKAFEAAQEGMMPH